MCVQFLDSSQVTDMLFVYIERRVGINKMATIDMCV